MGGNEPRKLDVRRANVDGESVRWCAMRLLPCRAVLVDGVILVCDTGDESANERLAIAVHLAGKNGRGVPR